MEGSPALPPEGPVHMNVPSGYKLLSLGVSGLVFAIDDETVLKRPNGFPNSDEDIAIEKRIYERIGQHPSIVKCIRIESEGITLERLLYPLRKRLWDLRATNETPSDTTVFLWAKQIIRGLAYIHSLGVLQADIGCHNILIDKDDNVKISDFAGASIDGEKSKVCYETRSRQPRFQNVTVGTEIFALGTALYELSTTSPPYPDIPSDTPEIGKLYAEGRFPNTKDLLLGEVIDKCWVGRYSEINDVHRDIERLQRQWQRAKSGHVLWNWHSISSILPRRLPRYVDSQSYANRHCQINYFN